MPTLSQLVNDEILHEAEDVLEPWEQWERRFLLTCRAKAWVEEQLPNVGSDGFYENSPSPVQQLDDLLYEFLSGADMVSGWPPHAMEPDTSGVWELRTADLRIFGWFYRHSIFIASAMDAKSRCEAYGLYAGYRDQCHTDMLALDLPKPLFVTGEMCDVL